METIKLQLPLSAEQLKNLKAGDALSLSGVIYTARDKAHKALCELLAEGKELPIELENQALYYCGPCPAKPGKPIGPAGPTTSKRMDAYTPTLLEAGVRLIIGKGPRNDAVKQSLMDNGAVYLATLGGAAALIAESVKSAELIAFPEFGAEAIYKLEVEDLFCIVAGDTHGNDLYLTGPTAFAH